MLQAAVLDCQFPDLLPFPDDGLVTPEADVRGCDVVQALAVSLALALGLRMEWRTANVIHLLIAQPFCQAQGS